MRRVTGKQVRRETSARAWLVLAALLVPAAAEARAQQRPIAVRRIVVSIPDRKLALIEDGRVLKVYRVAVGKLSTPTATGAFRIVRRLSNPAYYQPGIVIPPGKGNPLGTRWLGLDQPGFGIHGTNAPGTVGRFASHGCIRMRNRDVEELFARVRVGDVVELRGERDAELAQLFGSTESAREQLAALAADPGGKPAVAGR
jgi:lipoprotein-anchoring transpeptidase ErfK/SrfK